MIFAFVGGAVFGIICMILGAAVGMSIKSNG